jgi:AhpD family alkylhydroperoxidase
MENIILKEKLKPIGFESANERQKALLELTMQTYGQLPQMQMIMANMPPLLQSYLEGMKMFRNEGLFTPEEQEAIFIVISHENECYYCLAAHGMLAQKNSQLTDEEIRKIKRNETLGNSIINVLIWFVKQMIDKKGFVNEEDIVTFVNAGYSQVHVLSIIQAMAMKLMSNYTNHIFQREMNDKLKEKIMMF